MKGLRYKGYVAAVAFDAEDDIFTGRIVGISDVVGFHATTVDDLKAAFRDAVDDYLETCASVGKIPERAYSGQLMLRVDPSVHALASKAAEVSGRTLNDFGEAALREAALRVIAAE